MKKRVESVERKTRESVRSLQCKLVDSFDDYCRLTLSERAIEA